MIKGINVYYIYFMLSQVIWGVLPAFWILLRTCPRCIRWHRVSSGLPFSVLS